MYNTLRFFLTTGLELGFDFQNWNFLFLRTGPGIGIGSFLFIIYVFIYLFSVYVCEVGIFLAKNSLSIWVGWGPGGGLILN